MNYKKTTYIMLATLSLTLTPSCMSPDMPDDQRTMKQAKLTGVATGALVGAGAGVAAAHLSGNKNDALLAGILGGIIGGMAGYQMGKEWGASIVQRKNAYANVEDYYKANIGQGQTTIAALHSDNSRLYKRIATLKKQRAEVVASKDPVKIKAFNQQVSQEIADHRSKASIVQRDLNQVASAYSQASSSGNKNAKAQLQTVNSTMKSNMKAWSKTAAPLSSLSIGKI